MCVDSIVIGNVMIFVSLRILNNRIEDLSQWYLENGQINEFVCLKAPIYKLITLLLPERKYSSIAKRPFL